MNIVFYIYECRLTDATVLKIDTKPPVEDLIFNVVVMNGNELVILLFAMN